jgi:hypothetical protein
MTIDLRTFDLTAPEAEVLFRMAQSSLRTRVSEGFVTPYHRGSVGPGDPDRFDCKDLNCLCQLLAWQRVTRCSKEFLWRVKRVCCDKDTVAGCEAFMTRTPWTDEELEEMAQGASQGREPLLSVDREYFRLVRLIQLMAEGKRELDKLPPEKPYDFPAAAPKGKKATSA